MEDYTSHIHHCMRLSAMPRPESTSNERLAGAVLSAVSSSTS